GWETPSTTKTTEPVGIPPPGAAAATVAVKVMLWPTITLLGEAVTVTVEFALLTTWLSGALVLPLKFAVAVYAAVIVLVAETGRLLSARVAWPALIATG